MPLFKGKESKSTPHKAIAYITREDKAAFVSVRNLFEDEDYAEQFEQTQRRYCKGKKYDERKYYHFKLSCDRKDKAHPEYAHAFAEELAARLFPDDECVIATHTDTQTVHSHIIVNAVNPVTGKKLHFTTREYTAMKDEANRLGKEMGFSTLDFRKKSKNKRTNEERHIILKGGTSWKEDLREVIEEAKQTATTQEAFIAHLKLYCVEVTRSKTEYSFLHPEKKKAIRGHKLGEDYSKEIIDAKIAETRNRRNNNAYGARTIQAINENKHRDLENSLLKEALSISNNKCNSLIETQNTLVEDLIFQVEKVKENNEWHEAQLESKTNKAVQEIRQIAQEERKFKSEVSQAIRTAIRGTADEVTAYAKSQMDKSTENIKRELAECARELAKQREDMKEQSLIRKIFFWATPAFLLIQTVLLAFALFA